MKNKFTVTGMTCSACSAHVEKAVRKVEGVTGVSVNLLGGSMVVEHGDSVTANAIVTAVVNAGYGASPASAPTAPSSVQTSKPAADTLAQELAGMKRRFLLSPSFPCSISPWDTCWALPCPHSCAARKMP